MKKNYPDVQYLKCLAQEAGIIMNRNCQLAMSRDWKSDGTPVTATDLEISKLVINSLARHFPDVRVVGEEGGRDVEGAEYIVRFDPVDGTVIFSMGIPASAFIISLNRENQPIIAIIFDPFSGRIWHAVRGEGSFLNNKPIVVSQHRTIAKANIGVVWWKGAKYNLNDVYQKLLDAGAMCMMPGSIGYFGGLIASGACEATIFPSQESWETSAMHLIVEEARGKATNIYGDPLEYWGNGSIQGHIISNGWIHEDLVQAVAKCQLVTHDGIGF